MPKSFETRTVVLSELLSGSNTFRLPSFQRPYSWPPEKMVDLFDDLSTACQSEGSCNRGYFLGSIIAVPRASSNYYELVDGQQRLVSLTAMLAVLRDALSVDEARREIQDHIVRKANDLLGLSEAPRISLREAENDKFAKWVHTVGGTIALPHQGDTEAEKNLLNGLRRIQEDLGKPLSIDYARRLVRYILQRCHFILITAGSLEHAYNLFRCVNTLGQPLTDIDLARADLLGGQGIPESERTRICEAWETAEDELGPDELRGYIDTVATLVLPSTGERELLPRLRAIMAQPPKLTRFRAQLSNFLTSYVNLKSAALEYGPDSSQINREVRYLSALKMDEEWMPLAVLWLTTRHTPREAYMFFRALSALMLGILVLEHPRSERSKRLKRVSQGIREGWILTRATSEIYLKAQEVTKLQYVLEAPIQPSKKYLRPLLLRLNAEMTAPEVLPNFPSDLTLEHVLPQKPAAKSAWLEKFPDPQKRKHFSELLGNYALLTQKMNSKGRNTEFRKKKQVYFDFRDHQNFAITAQICQYDDWNEDVISRRQRELMKLARGIFSVVLTAV